jgi:hypothetical protein
MPDRSSRGFPETCARCHTWGYVVSSLLALWTADGSRLTYEPGELFVWEPGHAPAADVDTEYVELSPSDGYAGLMAHLRG